MKILIFDFDGTIADTKTLYYDAIYKNVRRFGYSYNDIGKVIDMGKNLRRTLRRLWLNIIITEFMKRRIMKDIVKKLPKVQKCEDVDYIRKIKGEKILVTNSLKEAVFPILKHFNLSREFKEIYGFEDFEEKSVFIKNYIKKRSLKKENCFYIGDRAADVKTAKDANCISIIISGKCSWDSKKDILKENPDFVVGSLKDLSKLFES